MNRTTNGEGRGPLAGTSSVLASATVTEPGDENLPAAPDAGSHRLAHPRRRAFAW
jgi:hypothetical protein